MRSGFHMSRKSDYYVVSAVGLDRDCGFPDSFGHRQSLDRMANISGKQRGVRWRKRRVGTVLRINYDGFHYLRYQGPVIPAASPRLPLFIPSRELMSHQNIDEN